MKKIKLNTVKSKMVAGVAAVTLFSGVGFVAANTDAGTALKGWYDGQFNNASADVAQKVGAYGNGKIDGLYKEYNDLKNSAATSIQTTKTTGATVATSNINSAKSTHINLTNTKKAELLSNMNAQFEGVLAFGVAELNTAGTQAIQYATNNLTPFVAGKGSTALTELENELNGVTNLAKQDLQTAIDNAKTELSNELTTKSNQTTEKLKEAIDNKIKELRDAITKKKNDLVKAQQDLITQKAQKMEADAKTDLDAIVSSINK